LSYTFSLAGNDAIPEIVSIYNSIIGIPGCTWNAEYPSIETAESDINSKSLYLLKRQEGIVAVVSAGSFNELGHLKWKPKNPCELARIGVIPSMQRQGVGTAFLYNVISAMMEKGYDGIRMIVSKNNPAALALYNKNGFEMCGETFMYDIDFYCYQMLFRITHMTGDGDNEDKRGILRLSS